MRKHCATHTTSAHAVIAQRTGVKIWRDYTERYVPNMCKQDDNLISKVVEINFNNEEVNTKRKKLIKRIINS